MLGSEYGASRDQTAAEEHFHKISRVLARLRAVTAAPQRVKVNLHGSGEPWVM